MPDTEYYCPRCDAFTPDGMPTCTRCGGVAFLPQLNDPARLQTALGPGFEVTGKLGEGAFGIVMQVHDRNLGRDLAVKILKVANRDLISRFSREASILANVRHVNIVPLFFVGAHSGVAYMAMPLLRGKTLRAALPRRGTPLALEEAVRVATELASGLDEAHRMGVVHRDIKPENVFVEDPDGRLCIMDFGIARIVQPDGPLSVKGTVIGTPEYMSPEQINGDPRIDGRADIYSLGCMVHEMVSGRPPFTGNDRAHPTALFSRHCNEPPPPLRSLRDDVPRGFEDAVLRALSKSADDRHASAGAFAADLRESLRSGFWGFLRRLR